MSTSPLAVRAPGLPARRHGLALGFIALVILIALFAPWIAPFDPLQGDGARRLEGPSLTSGHLLGLDAQGRDILSRLIHGARPSLLAGILPVALALVISLVLGLVAGYGPPLTGGIIMRGIDGLFAFPMILFAIAIVVLLGPGLPAILTTITVSLIPYMTRIVYAGVIAETGKGYLDSARLLGAGPATLLFVELLPNVLQPALIYATTLIGPMIGFSSGLSFLGLGIQPPEADWGRMTVEGVAVFAQGAIHIVLAPGIAIILTSLAFNRLGRGT